jgi:predicted metal-binding membrane protein
MTFERNSQQAFLGTSALLFVASAALTTVWCGSMSAMGQMPMPGGWTMSMAWMPMPGQTWLGAAASFVGMWVVMMVAMMLPSLVPTLWRYRQTIGSTGEVRLNWLTALVAMGYFFVWTMCGVSAFPLGAALAEIEMQQPSLARVVPIAIGVVVVIAGALQFAAWNAHHLACCRETPGQGGMLSADAGMAWRHGLRLGLHCIYGCAGFTAILLVIGVMDLRVMALVTAAITAERRARRASYRGCRGRGRAALDCEGSSRAWITHPIIRIVRNGARGSSRHTHVPNCAWSERIGKL